MMRWLVVASIVSGVIAVVACSKKDDGPTTGVHCSPGARTTCLCESKDRGTWVCNDQGNGYGPCLLPNQEACPNARDDKDAGDPCSGMNVTLSDTEQLFTDDTSSGTAIFKGLDACGDSDAKEKVYVVTSPKDGKATVRVEPGSAFDANVYVRGESCGTGAQVACSETGGAGKTESITFNVTAGTTYTVVVDGTASSSGTYKVAFGLSTGACSNGKPESGETCDDGNTSDGDGCNATCTKADGDPPSGNACPGQDVHVWDAPTTATGTLGSYANHKQSEGCALVGGSAPGENYPEHIYNVTAHKTGTMTILATPTDTTFDFVLYARSACDDQSSELKCANTGGDGAGETLTFPVTKDTSYMVALDGVTSGTQLPFTVTFGIQ